AEDGIRDFHVTGVQTCALPIYGGDKQLVVMAEHRDVQADPVAPRHAVAFIDTYGQACLAKHPVAAVFEGCRHASLGDGAVDVIQIGRASCRGRVEMWEVAAAMT